MTKWERFKSIVLQICKTAVVKAALLRFLGSVVSGGWKVWIVKFIVSELFDEIAEPIIKLGFRKMGYFYDRAEGEISLKRVEEARESGDKKAYDNAIDDIFK